MKGDLSIKTSSSWETAILDPAHFTSTTRTILSNVFFVGLHSTHLFNFAVFGTCPKKHNEFFSTQT